MIKHEREGRRGKEKEERRAREEERREDERRREEKGEKGKRRKEIKNSVPAKSYPWLLVEAKRGAQKEPYSRQIDLDSCSRQRPKAVLNQCIL